MNERTHAPTKYGRLLRYSSAAVLVFDDDTGVPVWMLDGSEDVERGRLSDRRRRALT